MNSTLRLFLAAAMSLLLVQAVPGQQTILELFAVRDDFQGEGLGQWASYPPAQDIGYEPSISPTRKFDAPGGRALMRVVRPTGPGEFSIGFIKRVNLVSDRQLSFSFSYRINALTNSNIEIGLAGKDANRYVSVVSSVNNSWRKQTVRLTDFRDGSGKQLTSGVGIEAIYVVAHIENANPDTTYRFFIDNVVMAASHNAAFRVTNPPTTQLEPWTALVSNLEPSSGELLQIQAEAPGPLSHADYLLQSDKRTISRGTLYDDGTHGDRKAQDGIWSNGSAHTFTSSDAPGLWNLQLLGTSSDGRTVTTNVRFIYKAPGVGRPRLFFTANDREKLVSRTVNPRLSAWWSNLRERAKASRNTGDLSPGGEMFELLDEEYLLPTLLGYFDILNRARARISSNSFDAYITGDKESLAAAKGALLDVARWSRWNPPWFNEHGQQTYYPAGQLAVDVAFAYDLLYDNLTSAERAEIRRALLEKSIIPTYKEYVVDNRAMANTSNWISHTVAGALIAATAISGDTAPAENLPTYVNGLLLKLEDHMAASFLSDGSYGEGTSYQEFDLETLGVALPAIKRVFGIDYYSQTHVKDSFIYSLYTVAQPTSESLDMGDTHPPSARTLAPFVAQSKDPAIHWYFQLFEHSSLHDFIFYDDSVKPGPPDLPSSRIFSKKGFASFRTGWKPDDWVFLYRAGPTFNHNHSDQGSFLLTAFGENLVSEAGWSDYYKDPYYETFFTQAVGHNTVLVNGDPQSQSIADTAQFAALTNHPRITDAVTSEFYDAVSSELSSVYKGRLTRYTRRIVFLKPYYFVVYDDLAANNASTFDWLLHLPERAKITRREGGATYTGDKATLAVQVLSPISHDLRIHNGHIPYPVFASSTPKVVPKQPAFLDVRNTAPATSMQFLVALVPAQTQPAAQNLAEQMTRIEGTGVVGLQTNRGAETDLIMFRGLGVKGLTTYRDIVVDANAWSLVQAGNQTKLFAAEAARGFKRAGRTFLTSDHPISVVANYANKIDVSLNAKGTARVSLYVGQRPTSVRLNETTLRPDEITFDASSGMLSLTLPAGSHRLLIQSR